jgi:hypothetical protein
MAGLSVDVLRSPGCDCTNGGESSRFDRFILTWDDGQAAGGMFALGFDMPELVLVRDECFGEERLRAIPRELVERHVWTMFGGNFCWCSDSRFPSRAPIKIHDRVEP